MAFSPDKFDFVRANIEAHGYCIVKNAIDIEERDYREYFPWIDAVMRRVHFYALSDETIVSSRTGMRDVCHQRRGKSPKAALVRSTPEGAHAVFAGHIAVSDELTDRAYWERTWNDGNIPMSVDLTDHGIRNHATLTVHRYFETVLCAFRRRQTSLIELGCAQSKWLPYFARHWRFDVAGLDSSELGCQRARQMLAARSDGRNSVR